MPFCSVEGAIEEVRAGRFIIVLDDEGRENEGDLVIAAEMATPRGEQPPAVGPLDQLYNR